MGGARRRRRTSRTRGAKSDATAAGFGGGGVAIEQGSRPVVRLAGSPLVGFDIACGVRCLRSGLTRNELDAKKNELADWLSTRIPAGLGSRGRIRLDDEEMDAMLSGGAAWAVARGWGLRADLERIEEHGCMVGARPDCVSQRARERQRAEMGTLGSGNHYLEVQEIAEVFARDVAEELGLRVGEVVVSLHCGSRGLGHQVGPTSCDACAATMAARQHAWRTLSEFGLAARAPRTGSRT